MQFKSLTAGAVCITANDVQIDSLRFVCMQA